MNSSIALNLIGCHELTSNKEIQLALEAISHYTSNHSCNNHSQSQTLLKQIQQTISSLPSFNSSNLSPISNTPVIHYQVNDYVWCCVGGWGYWPGQIAQFTDTTMIIDFLQGEQTAIELKNVNHSIKSFLHHFQTYTTVSTSRLNGFEEATNTALSNVAKEKLLPSDILKEIKNRNESERWSSYIKRIGNAIQNHLNGLQSLPIFRDMEKIIGKYKKYLLKKKEEEEREALLLPKLASPLPIPESSIVIPMRRNGKKLSVKEMLNELEKTSIFSPQQRRVLRSSIQPHSQSTLQRNNKKDKHDDNEVEENDENDTTTTNESSHSKLNQQLSETELLSIQTVLISLLDQTLQAIEEASYPQIVYSPSLHSTLYQYLYTLQQIPHECLAHAITHSLPNIVIQMLLTRFNPTQLFDRLPTTEKTLFHLCVQNDNHKLLDMLIQFHCKHHLQTLLTPLKTIKDLNDESPLLDGSEDGEDGEGSGDEGDDDGVPPTLIDSILLLKDSQHQTLIHLCCVCGSDQTLLLLHRLLQTHRRTQTSFELQLQLEDINGHTPFFLCTFNDRSQDCADFLLSKSEWLTCLSFDERVHFFSGCLHNCIKFGAVEVGKVLLAFISKSDNSWMIDSKIVDWCSDMSLGRERYRIIFDIRDMEECKQVYLESTETTKEIEAKKELTKREIKKKTTTPKKQNEKQNGKRKSMNVETAEQEKEQEEEEKEFGKIRIDTNLFLRRSTRKIVSLYPYFAEEQKKRKLLQEQQAAIKTSSKPSQTQQKNKKMRLKDGDEKVEECEQGDDENEEEEDDDDEEEEAKDRRNSQSPSKRSNRISNRVGALSLKDIDHRPLPIELSSWKISQFMLNFLKLNDRNESATIPHFIYSTEPYWNFDDQSNNQTLSSSNGSEVIHKGKQNEVDETGTVSTGGAYLPCCKCTGDCANNPTCPCIMRNGQRSPYSKDGLFDFSKAKIYECGPECSCHKKHCSLRRTQHGVSLPLIVCQTSSKGFGVMATKVILKGAFVCAYVGERMTEEDLEKHEEKKLDHLRSLTTSDENSSETQQGDEIESENGNSNDETCDANSTQLKGYITYTFQVHDGIDVVNIDSEYIGNVARFFNHSCDPNLRPMKVICYRGGRSYLTMAFFALRRIEPGEELTWKYVSGITRRSGQRCYCNTSNCVGFL